MTDSPGSPPAGERLAKVIARAGLCSRRDAEGWIREGRVAVNGNVIRTPAFNVTEKDRITVDGEPLQLRSGTRLWLYHKPPGLVVTEKDPEGRPTIFEALTAEGLPRVLTIGRLDINTEGLLLLTNDGGLKRVLELPATGWLRRYRVRAFGTVTQAVLDGLKAGLEIEGIKYGPIEATLERQQGSNVWLLVALREGKNREVKNVLGTLGLSVNRLIRISYGPFQLGDLKAGAVEPVRARVLRDQLGKKLAEEAGVDFDSDMPEVATARRERPGRPGDRPEPRTPREGRERRIHFDDGRPPETIVEPSDERDRRERPSRSGERKFAERERSRPSRAGATDRRSDRPASRSPRPDSRPTGRPAGPGSTRSGARPSGSGRPTSMPSDPSSRPANRPSGANSRPARPSGPSNRPANRPSGTNSRPTRSSGPSNRPANRPSGTNGRPTRSSGPSNRPANRPSGANSRPARPSGPNNRPRPSGPGSRPRPGGGKPPRRPRS